MSEPVKPRNPPRRRPAERACQITGVGSVATMVLIGGWMAVSEADTVKSTPTAVAAAAPSTTVAPTATTAAPAAPATATTQRATTATTARATTTTAAPAKAAAPAARANTRSRSS